MDKGEKRFHREGGVLLHPTALPGPYGIGDLGSTAWGWIDWLSEAGCRIWQVLPLGPTGYGDSPYQSFSSFAGNPLLISPESLMAEGLLREDDLESIPEFSDDRIHFGTVIAYKDRLLNLAMDHFRAGITPALEKEFQVYCQQQSYWLDDFTLFMAIKGEHEGISWTDWEPSLALRKSHAISRARERLKDEIEAHRFRQFLFSRQWQTVRQLAAKSDLKIIGDLPIFVAHDSADVWAHPEFFFLDDAGMPTVVAGVPPDYFSPTGQRWGNPLYRWDVLRDDGYTWWLSRLESVLSMVDLVRLDHFRGFQAYWEIPAEDEGATTGRWRTGPGEDFLEVAQKALGDLPIIAEDLGLITPEVVALREVFNLPGMKVMQFAFDGDATHEYLPHNFERHCVAYTGTHDNDTSRGWYASAPEETQEFCRRYLGCNAEDIAWGMIKVIWSSVADMAIAPMQDLLELGSEARMNFPSRAEGNWQWRVRAAQLSPQLAGRMQEMSVLYGRLVEPTKDKTEDG
ncbi:MAG: 4-alpha-glucanotransferase [Anaerolineae bacterium SM23_ 63]|nr:MAG: 4-alpha-glucanotransferase [Anaerolineae bacterium SM23_ 63]HEY47549.1 4-alpha-glucanotransferase [Anaerolineae bacterium]